MRRNEISRPSIPVEVKRALFEQARGHCQYPECLEPLFPPDLGGTTHLAEMAHIIPWGHKGPRHEGRTDGSFDAHSAENLILLHPTCHTRVDKRPDLYPPEVLRGWKELHANTLDKKIGILKYSSRREVAEALDSRMRENYAIWRKYAPTEGSEFEFDPESDTARVWDQRMKSVIIPNHYHALSVLALNQHLASPAELTVIAEYKEHVRGLTERHISSSKVTVIRFPLAMNELFR